MIIKNIKMFSCVLLLVVTDGLYKVAEDICKIHFLRSICLKDCKDI